jgi:sortase A
MRKIISKIMMITGVMLIVAALALFLFNLSESLKAAKESREMLARLEAQMNSSAGMEVSPPGGLPADSQDMAEIIIDGHAYVGYLSLPTLNLELPVMADWDYNKLQISPCRYYGTVKGENLVIMAHNYAHHFGPIVDLNLGDSVVFTDVNGVASSYKVVGQDVLDPYAVKEMVAGDFDLTLFTCTYGGKTRVTVYCDLVEAE